MFGKGAVLDFGQNLFHGLADMRVDDPGAAGVIAVLGRIAYGVAHVTQTALIKQVNDELQLMHTFEVGDLRLVSGSDQRFKSGLYQRADAAAQYRLLAEQIALGLFFERGLDDAGLEIARRPSISKSILFRATARVLMHRQERRHPNPFNKQFAHAVAWALRGDHRNVNQGGRDDLTEVNVEAMSEHQCLTRTEVRLN